MQTLENVNVCAEIHDKKFIKEFKTVIQVLNKYHNELLFTLDKYTKTLYLCSMDTANVVLTELFVELNDLSSNTDKFKFQVNAKELNNFLKCFKEHLEIEITDTDLILKDNIQKYSLKLIDCTDLEHAKSDTINYNEYKPLNVDSYSFLNHLKTFKKFETLELKVIEEKLLLNVDNSSITLVNDLFEQTARSCKYSIDYLYKLIPLKNFELELNFTNNYPIKLDFKRENINLRVYLAPRVDDE